MIAWLRRLVSRLRRATPPRWHTFWDMHGVAIAGWREMSEQEIEEDRRRSRAPVAPPRWLDRRDRVRRWE